MDLNIGCLPLYIYVCVCVCVLKFCNALGHLISKLTRADLLDEIINRFLCLFLCEFREYPPFIGHSFSTFAVLGRVHAHIILLLFLFGINITIVLYLEGPCIDLIIPTIITLKIELSIMDQFVL